MGFYECIHDCGDNCYCVSIASSLDMFESIDWIYCLKHKDPTSRKQICNLRDFIRRYGNYVTNCKVEIKIVSTKNGSRGLNILKLELVNFDEARFNALKLKNSKKIYFSEFDDEPSWTVVNGIVNIIGYSSDFQIESTVNSPPCNDPNIIFNWYNRKVMTIEEYREYEKTRDKMLERKN